MTRCAPKLSVAPHVEGSMVAPAVGPLPLRGAARVLWAAVRGTSTGVQPRTDADFAMERYAGGDSAAFAQVYDALAPRLYGYLLRQTRDRARSEDLLQQTMLHIHRARERFIAGAEVRPWAFAIARRLLVDDIRRGRRVVLSDDGDPDPGRSEEPMADEVVQASELAVRIQAILAKLPTSQRAAFELIKQEGLTVAEAAQVLGTTVAAVKLRAHRAYEALRAALGESTPGSREVTRERSPLPPLPPELRARVLAAVEREPVPPRAAGARRRVRCRRARASARWLLSLVVPRREAPRASARVHRCALPGWLPIAAVATWAGVGQGRSMLGRPAGWLARGRGAHAGRLAGGLGGRRDGLAFDAARRLRGPTSTWFAMS